MLSTCLHYNKHWITLRTLASILFVFTLSMSWVDTLIADEIKVAVASNFTRTITTISQGFEKKTGHKVKLIFGSTGKHYAQIVNGAPYDIFFAADSRRPLLLEKKGLAQPGSRFTYAIGQLVLWSPDKNYIDPQAAVIGHGTFYYMAIANPKLAPYGKAAMQILKKRGVWTSLQKRLVRGENIAQTFQFVMSGNAKLGFVAYSQIKQLDNTNKGSYWVAPQKLYTPVKQQAVLLKESQAARAFLAFVRSPVIKQLIDNDGYNTPK